MPRATLPRASPSRARIRPRERIPVRIPTRAGPRAVPGPPPARGYAPGVYSSAASGVEDLGNATSVGGHPLARPKSIWFALWDGRRNVKGAPYLARTWWPGERRIKQFRGARWQKHGGFRLNIDIDRVFGAVD